MTELELVQPDEYVSVIDGLMALSPDEFDAMGPEARMRTLFILVRETLGEVRSLTDTIVGMERKAAELASPDNLMAMAEKFLGGGML